MDSTVWIRDRKIEKKHEKESSLMSYIS